MTKAKAVATVPRATVTLYERTAALLQVDQWIKEAEGELTPELEALMDEALGDFASKVRAYVALILEADVEAGWYQERIDALLVHRGRAISRGERLRTRLTALMQVANQLVVTTDDGITVKVKDNPKSVQAVTLQAPAVFDPFGTPMLVPDVDFDVRLQACLNIAQPVPGEAKWDRTKLLALWKRDAECAKLVESIATVGNTVKLEIK